MEFEFLQYMRIKEGRSDVYMKALNHRKTCAKWNNGFCLECFGGGLTLYTEHLFEELEAKGKK